MWAQTIATLRSSRLTTEEPQRRKKNHGKVEEAKRGSEKWRSADDIMKAMANKDLSTYIRK